MFARFESDPIDLRYVKKPFDDPFNIEEIQLGRGILVSPGAIFPLTGGAAAVGRELRAGAELSAEIANTTMADINMTMAKNRGITSMRGAKIEIIFNTRPVEGDFFYLMITSKGT